MSNESELDDKNNLIDVLIDNDEASENVENIFMEPSKEELQDTINETKIELTEEDKDKYKPVEKKKRGRQTNKIPSSDELDEMTDEEVIDNMSDQDKELYMEFSAFLEDKAKIKQDDGIKEIIPTGIDVLDAILGGGFAVGTLGMVAGPPGSGKSMIAIQTMASAQQKYKGNMLVSYLDSEEATTTVRMSNLGVKYPKIKPYNDITVEKVFKFIEGLCLYKEVKNIIDIPSIVVWDSVANTLSQKEREVEDISYALAYKARLLSLLIPKYVSKLAIYNICLICVNQLRDSIQIGPYQKPKEMKFMSEGKTVPGGNTLKFNAFHFLEMRVKGSLSADKLYGFDGIACEVHCVKNKLFPPNIKVLILGDFVRGFSNFWTNYSFLVSNKRIDSGAWNKIVNDPKQTKFRTKDAFNLYNTDLYFKEMFDAETKDTIKKELIEKNNPEI